MTPPPRPLLLYDGACAFCRAWIGRWQHVLGDRVECAPYQDAAGRAPGVPRERLAEAVHLVEPDGRVSLGAEAVFRSLAHAPGRGGALALYRRLPGFAAASEACYRWVARHRPLAERLTRAIWGPHVVPPGERRVAALFLRALGAVYAIAFLSLGSQIVGLVGREGILPAGPALDAVAGAYGAERFWLVPTLAWLGAGDAALQAMCAGGVVLALLLAAGLAPAATLAGCWLLYLSLVTVAREFCAFQWDALLLECSFLAIFLAPLRLRARHGVDAPPSRLALWALRALLVRLMVSSAVAKLAGGDPSWRDLTALTYHYETQCLPPWTAWYAHQLPEALHRFSAVGMFAIEGLAPFLVLAPRRIRFAGAGAMVALQGAIAATGNYGFFNLLTAALALLLLDDGALPWRRRAAAAAAPAAAARGRWPRWLLRPALAALLLLGVVPLVQVLRAPTAWLGPLADGYRALAPLRIVNAYGLFSVMTTRRPEIVLETSEDGVRWRELAFRWKPGDVRRRPGFVAPHQPRLDWQMWFAALSDVRREPWFLAFCERLLAGSPPVWRLLAEPPPARPPRYLRARRYDYRFTDPALRRAGGAWWRREPAGLYAPVMTLEAGRLVPAPVGLGRP